MIMILEHHGRKDVQHNERAKSMSCSWISDIIWRLGYSFQGSSPRVCAKELSPLAEDGDRIISHLPLELRMV